MLVYPIKIVETNIEKKEKIPYIADKWVFYSICVHFKRELLMDYSLCESMPRGSFFISAV